MPQLARRRRREPEEDNTQDNVASEPEQQSEESGSDVDDSALKIDEWTKALVRLALAAEYQRKALTRDMIREKVLGRAPRSAFRKVFEQAQEELRSIFGMELVELPANEKRTMQDKRAAHRRSTVSKPVVKWILCSTLPTQYQVPGIVAPPAIPTSDQDSTYTAIYTTLISLILLNNGSLPDAKFERFLRRLGMEDSTPVIGADRTEQLKKRLRDHGYVDYTEESIGNNGEVEINWFVGPRGKLEVGHAGVKGLVKMVYGNPEGNEGTELLKKINRSLGFGERQAATPRDTQKRKRASNQPNNDARNGTNENDDDDDDDDDDQQQQQDEESDEDS